MEEYMLPCLNKKLFGFECMGCGFQRSLVFLIRGDFAQALHIYPAIFPLLLLFGFLITTYFVKFRFSTIITTGLALLTCLTILTSYIYKLTTY
ncbi:MAG: hypothetical protein CL868_19445 [Cytophagaceae bacterium]|nr:hypothetical protein [Cytophagaceae bacterium]